MSFKNFFKNQQELNYYWSYPSIRELEIRIKKFFLKKGFKNVVVFGVNCQVEWPMETKIELALLGDGLDQLAYFKAVPKNRLFRIWVLSQSAKSVLVDFLKIPESSIFVIPRYELFPYKKTKKSKIKNICIVSRFSQRKNPDLLVAVSNELQKKILGSRVYICGPRLKKSDISKMYQPIKWHKPPLEMGDMGSSWFKKFSGGTLVLNFSSDYYEDFGVAVAQAQSQGFWVACHAWACYREVQGAIQVPHRLIGTHLDPVTTQRAKRIAEYIMRELTNPLHFKKAKKIRSTGPAEQGYLSYKQIKSYSKNLKKTDLRAITLSHINSKPLPKQLHNRFKKLYASA